MPSARLVGLCSLFALAYAFDYALFVVSWWLLGRALLSSPLDSGLLLVWALALASMLPLRVLSTWSAGEVAVGAGELLKRRLLRGAMLLSPDELRADGAGRHLARVFESEAVETLALSGGLLSIAASIEIAVALAILAAGARAPLGALVLAAAVAAFSVLARRYFLARRLWTEARLEMSHELVEKMVGHRTRLAQEPPGAWHLRENEALGDYERKSRAADRLHVRIQALPRLFLLLGILGLTASEQSLERLAVGLGGAILAARALQKLADGFSELVDAAVAWKRVEPLFRAAGRKPEAQPASSALVEAEDVSFIYGARALPVLERVRFGLTRGDRVLLTSPSGGGKSTLVSLLNGLRKPTSGGVRVGGTVATAPQFHENHVFTESFAFNLLMARAWPPSRADMEEADALCREIGLGDLLDKMPGGMNQMVGDTGWRLSHGERSRLFLARALLQRADLVLLDESFAALDPENLRLALLTARERASTLLVVAHV
jgi:ATP-binding cassette subfamily B protein